MTQRSERSRAPGCARTLREHLLVVGGLELVLAVQQVVEAADHGRLKGHALGHGEWGR